MRVDITENLFIAMPDGARLAARLWLPEGAGDNPVPAILEYIPYRKRDGTRGRDEPMHGYFAAQGYGVLRVDMRGSGDSDDLMDDEYLPLEQEDACHVIAWAAAQPWCTGKVGMMGKSWGGFNCLQVAARRPPALTAVITVCSTDDRYSDDIHYMGGCLLNDNLWWATIMLGYQVRPPDPAIVGPRWRDMWRERIEHLPFFPALWARHPHRDAYWKQGSICEDFSAINVPVFAWGGWADAYTNAVPRLLAGLDVPRLGVIGPWAHLYAHDGVPGPAVGFLQEATRFWDLWLKGKDTGIMAEPMLRAWMEDSEAPATTRAMSKGRWVGEPVWPSRRIREEPYFLSSGQLWRRPPPEERMTIHSPNYVGAMMGEWMGTGVPGEAPADQRFDDGLSLVFDSRELADKVEILGAPRLVVELSADQPQAQLAVRLSDVAPDGSATRVSYAVLDLTHRNSHEDPEPLKPGEPVRISLKLNDCGHVFPAGHRIRVAISTGLWPLVWPSPEPVTLTILTGDSALILPVRPPRREDAAIRFEGPEKAPDAPVETLSPSRLERRFELDLLNDRARYVTVGEGGLFGEGVQRFTDIDTLVSHSLTRNLSIDGQDPNSARYDLDQELLLGREGWKIRIETKTGMTSTPTHFRMTGTVRAFENDTLFAERHFDESIERG